MEVPPPPSLSFAVKRSFSTPCDPRDEDDFPISQRLTKTPPLTPKKSGKMLALKIQLLDDSVTIIQAQTKALGKVVFDQVCKQLNILEADYFGLEYQDSCGTKYWLDLEKRLSRQVGLSLCTANLRFSVKFYTPDPSQLEEEFTRYLFSLQIKRDLATGTLQCNDNTASLMASFIVQAECGDFNEDDYPDASYLSTFKFVPHQDLEMEKRIRENHRKHCGQSPAEADLHLLETARRTELYGIKMHPAKDEEGVPLNLSVCHLGIIVFQNFTKINTFSWAKIRKLSFKRKRFILKLHPEGYGYYKETVEFLFETRNECKSFWKSSVEHHTFFRCEKAPNLGSTACRSKGLLTSRGSSFRYSGRTQKQMVAFVRENFVKRDAAPTPAMGGSSAFQSRSASFRSTHNVMSSSSGGGHHSGLEGVVVEGMGSGGISTSCSSPAMMSASAHLPLDDQVMDKIYPNMDYPDSPVDIRSQDSQQGSTLSPGTSVTSSPQRYVPAMGLPQHHEPVVPPPPIVYHPQYPPQGQSPEYYNEKLSEESEVESDMKLFGTFGQNEFPVTTFKNVERKLKIIESQPMVSVTGLSAQQPKEIIRRTRKQRSKSLTVRSEISVSEDDDEINYFTIPRRKEKISRKKVTDDEFHRPGDETTSQGSYDLLVSNERVDEIASGTSSVGGSRRKLIHQKESFYDDFDDSIVSPTTLIPPSLVIPPPSIGTVTPSASSPTVPPTTVVTETPSGVPVSSTPVTKKPEEKVKRVLNLKSEEQLVEEASIWLETGAISTSGSFKRKMKKKQEVIEKLESEIITYSHRSKDNITNNTKSKSHNTHTKDFGTGKENARVVTSSGRRPIVHSHSNPIEVDVSVIKSSAFSEFPPIPTKRTMSTTNSQIKISPETVIAPCITSPTSVPPDVVPLPPPTKFEENNKSKAKCISVTTERDENESSLQKVSQIKSRSMIKSEMTRRDKEIIEPSSHETNGVHHPAPPKTPTTTTRESYQIAPNEIVSKSFELEPLIEDEHEPSSTVIDEDHEMEEDDHLPEKSQKFHSGDVSSSSGGFGRKNFVRKTKSEGAFDTMCKPSGVLKRSSTERKPGRTSIIMSGSTGGGSSGKGSSGNVSTLSSTDGHVPTTTKSCIHFEEVDVPYLLRRRIDLESTSSSPGSTANLYHHESLSKSKSYGGTTSVCDSSSTSSAQQLKRLIYCSMTDLPPVTNFSWRDDTLDHPIWDESDPFSFAVRRTQRGKLPKKSTIPSEQVGREEVETAAADLVNDIMKSVNAEFVKNLNEVLVDGNYPTDCSTIVEEVEEDLQPGFGFGKRETIVTKIGKGTIESKNHSHNTDYQNDTEMLEEEWKEPEEKMEIVGKDDDEISSEDEKAYEEEEEEEENGGGMLQGGEQQSNFFYQSIREEDEDMINPEGVELEDVVEEEEDQEMNLEQDGANILSVDKNIPKEIPYLDLDKLDGDGDNNLDVEDDKTMTPEDILAPSLEGKVEGGGTTTTKSSLPSTSSEDDKQIPMDVSLKRSLRKDSTASMDDFPLPPLPDAELEYNCETPRYPPPPPDILQFNYPSRRGSYNRRRSSAEMEQTSMTDPDWLHYMCKEILATQRTFVADLKLIGKLVAPLLTGNSALLHNFETLEVRKEVWEAGFHGVQVITSLVKHFENYKIKYDEYFLALQACFEEFTDSEDFSHYLPLTALALKPLYRVLYYHYDVLPVLRTYETDTIRQHCSRLEILLSPLVSTVNRLQNDFDFESRAKIGELLREMPGFPQNPGKFLRQGILLKMSRRRGFQNRIFFLFQDGIIFGSRISSAAGFRLHGIVPLFETHMQQNFELEHQIGSIPNAFSLKTPQDKILVLAGMTERDKQLWINAIVEATENAKPNSGFLRAIGCSSEELLSGSQDAITPENNNNTIRNNNQVGHRSNATTHVCWHRNVSISHAELCRGIQCTISGFLLRKFKNSLGWQRLWVVFTNICLFFYKSFDESTPLASLPLLGYRVETPVELDEITKDHVFKLVFKNHVYFFRAESHFTFRRWMRALNQATQLYSQK